MAKFDGEKGVNVPESLIASDAFPTHKFTIATWMRHRHNKALDKHTKEHIICKADDHSKFLLYVLYIYSIYSNVPPPLKIDLKLSRKRA